MPTFLALVGMLISVLLIGIILLQRGRGGGLVGALSGLGGQSAFGTKAGDTFTRITIVLATVWVLLAGVHGQVLRARTDKFKGNDVRKAEAADQEFRSTKQDTGTSNAGAGTNTDSSDKSATEKADGQTEPGKNGDSTTQESESKAAPSSEPKAAPSSEPSSKHEGEKKSLPESNDDPAPKGEKGSESPKSQSLDPPTESR
jgi:preprotein translocase subunit SecG